MTEKQHTMSDLAAHIEAVLLAEGGSMPLKKLSAILASDTEQIERALLELAEVLDGTGMSLIRSEGEVSLATSPRTAATIRRMYEESLSRDIGSAGLEVLSIVLYRGPCTRARIDYIRGVNTSSTIRLLIARSLLERIPNPADSREYLYQPTTELLAHLGVRSSAELPNYATISEELKRFESAPKSTDTGSN